MFSFFRKKKKDQPQTPDTAPTFQETPDISSEADPWLQTDTEASDETALPVAEMAPETIQEDHTETETPVSTPAESEADAEKEALQAPLEAEKQEEVPAERRGWLSRLTSGLKKTGQSITQVFTGTQIDETLYEELETALLMADAGTAATQYLLDDLRERIKNTKTTEPAAVRTLLEDALTELLTPLESALRIGEQQPTVIMVSGVNGAGKTTTIGKLTRHLAVSGCKVLLAAGDTFRAAAREQLAVWADRNTVEVIAQQGGDPASVSYDAVTAGRARGVDVVLVDTAGRLATQLNLMDELKKVRRVIGKAMEGAPHEVLLVVDGNTGQNALAQVKAFDAAIDLTGLVVTKLDGTAKGGVIAAIALWSAERQKAGSNAVPVYFIGVGEQVEDLQTFNAREFAHALLHD